MQLSLHTDYALRVLMLLGGTGTQWTIDEIAAWYGISRNHLAKVAQTLQAEGLVETQRGRGGGLRLARPPEEIVIGQVVQDKVIERVAAQRARIAWLDRAVIGLAVYVAFSGAVEQGLARLFTPGDWAVLVALVLVFGMFTLTAMQVVIMGVFTVLSLGLVMTAMVLVHPEAFDARLEFIKFVLTACTLPALSAVAFYVAQVRARLLQRKEALREALSRS